MKKTILLKSMLLLCALIVGSSYGWATADETINITYSNVSATSYNASETTFSESDITFGYKNVARNNSNGTPTGWAKNQVIQVKASSGVIYNTTAISGLKNIRVYVVVNTNSFTVTSGTSKEPTTNPVSRPTTATGSESITYSSYSGGVTTPGQTTTATYYDFPVSDDYFKIANGSNVLYIWKIVLTYEAFTITPISNDDDMGTVSVTGNTITASPNPGYRVIAGDDGYTVTSGTADVTNNADNTFSVTPSTDCTVRINFEEIPKHTVTFSVNGNIDRTASIREGESITFPTAADTPADANEFNKTINGKTFVGWCATEYRHASTAPSYINTSSTIMGDEDVTYFAVYATTNESTTTKTDMLTRATTGITGTTYTAWTNKQATDGSDAVYAGKSAGGNESIQIKAGDSDTGIITTTSGGKVKKVTVVWNSNTASGRSLDIYCKNSAYSNATDLYNNEKRGTKIGSIVYGTSTELSITGDYDYIGMRSSSNAMYLTSVTIDWEVNVTDYSNYNTTVTIDPDDPEDKGSTIEITTSDNMDGWRAFYDDSQDYTLDASTKAYVVRAKSENAGEVVLTKLDVTAIPQGEPVILKTSAANHKMVLTKTTGVASLGANKLAVTTGSDDVDGYRMGYGKIGGSDAVGFFKYVATTPAAGIVYIDKEYVNTGAGAHGLEITFADDETTAIKTVNAEKQLTAPRKVMKDGRIVVETNEGMFSLTGARVK